ncbi:hypothetical protein PC0401_17880 [Streptococcus pneumoniae]|nr:hypothetical protein PC0401_17880 [Streptococcus pneumoniae]
MKKNRGIQKLAILVLLGVFMFSNTIPYQQLFRRIDNWRFECNHKKNRMDLMLERQIKE